MRPIQLSTQIYARPTGAAAGASPFVGKASADSVCFGAAAKPLTDVEKLAKTQQEALELFLTPDGNPKSREEILKGIQAHFKGKVEVLDGAQPGNEWVNQTLETFGNQGMFNPADTLLYPDDPESKRNYVDESGKLPKEYLDVSNRHQKQKRAGLFVHKDAPLSVLMHETFHALQFANGLPMGGNSVKVQAESNEFRDELNDVSTSAKKLLNPFKRFLAWAAVPYRILTSGVPNAEKDQAGDTAGKALRNEMRREMEVDRFLLANGLKLGLSVQDYVTNAMHFVFESSLQYFRSLALG